MDFTCITKLMSKGHGGPRAQYFKKRTPQATRTFLGQLNKECRPILGHAYSEVYVSERTGWWWHVLG